MPDRILIGEPILTERETTVQLIDPITKNGKSGVLNANITVKIAKPGANHAIDAACTVTEVTGAADANAGVYRLRFSDDALSAIGEGAFELTDATAGGVFAPVHGGYEVLPLRDALLYGKAQGGASGSVTLPATASATDGFYAGKGHACQVLVVDGTGAGQVRIASDYVGATKVLSVFPDWAVQPDNTSVVKLVAVDPAFSLVAGLMQMNAVIDGGAGQSNVVYSALGLPITQRIRCFATAAQKDAATFGAADDADGEVFRFLATASDIGVSLPRMGTFSMGRAR